MIEAGPAAPACSSPLPFSAGDDRWLDDRSGRRLHDFSLLLQADDQQRIAKLAVQNARGPAGMISKVPLCGEPQAKVGTCSAASQIGHTIVSPARAHIRWSSPSPGSRRRRST